MRYYIFNIHGYNYDPNRWIVERDGETITIRDEDNLIIWQLTDKGETDRAAIAASIAATVVEDFE